MIRAPTVPPVHTETVKCGSGSNDKGPIGTIKAIIDKLRGEKLILVIE